METRIIYVCLLALIIDLVGTLAYSIRVVGVRTNRIALSFSLFNIMVLVARTANTLQAPILAKFVETRIATADAGPLLGILRVVLLSATVATLIGAVLIPTFQRLFSIAVDSFAKHESISRLLLKAAGPEGRRQILNSMVIPSEASLSNLKLGKRAPIKVLAANVIVVALGSCGTLAALYAGSLLPALRTTAITLTSAIYGIATLLLYLLVDPYLANLTDKVASGRESEGFFRKCVSQMVGARLAGTVLAQLLLLPAALLIAGIAKIV